MDGISTLIRRLVEMSGLNTTYCLREKADYYQCASVNTPARTRKKPYNFLLNLSLYEIEIQIGRNVMDGS